MRYTITLTCKARKKIIDFLNQTAKNERKLIDLLIYSLYSDAISYHELRVCRHCSSFNVKINILFLKIDT